jgi:hypothetical protein
VQGAGDLPEAIRAAVLNRLHDVQWAVEHYLIVGAAGLETALDRLGVEMARTTKVSGAWRGRVGRALLYGWLIFSHVDEVVANLEASTELVAEVGEWVRDASALTEPERPELPAPAEAHDPDGDDVVDAEIVEE